MNIQWYPGHMTKTRRMMEENISLVDVVVELVDARIPYSSKNPDIDNIAKNKKRIIAFNKSDLSDEASNKIWSEYYEKKGYKVIFVNSITGKGVNGVTQAAKDLMAEKIESLKAKGRIFVPVRAMIVGIPNVGKSTFINKYVGKTMAKTGDKPGITRTKQWIRIKKDFELLDTPGILWPKFEDETVGIRLALTGAINDDILDIAGLGTELIKLLRKKYPESLKERYSIQYADTDMDWQILEKIGEKRGFKKKGGEIDLDRSAKILLDEFRGGKLGNITLELPEDIVEAAEKTAEDKEAKRQRDLERKRAFKKRNNKK
ncbi:MAG: ribosome biogenesis GTPase YlqF [Lachnospiraceae bacterium]|nr:ribosome biogenesis GTPase YlqF [Lachnospiraceae bacterium]